MKMFTFLLSLLLVFGWAISLFGFHAGKQAHFLLVLAAVNISGFFLNPRALFKQKTGRP